MVKMKSIPLEEIPKEYHQIALQNGKVAKLQGATIGIVPDIDPINETIIYRYTVPCPICDTENRGAYSYDGEFFANTQMTCSYCGVYYRPVKYRGNM